MKIMKKLAVLFLALLISCCALFSGCGAKQLKAGDVYTLQYITYTQNGMDYKINLGDMHNSKILQEDTYVLIVGEDNQVFFREKAPYNNIYISQYTWIHGYEKDEIYLFSSRGSAVAFIVRFDNNRLYMLDITANYVYVMKKA